MTPVAAFVEVFDWAIEPGLALSMALRIFCRTYV